MAVLDKNISTQCSIDPKDLHIEWFSGTGKGGQHRNKKQNSCKITHIPSGLQEIRQGRSRESNKRDAINSLEVKLLSYLRQKDNNTIDSNRRLQIGTGLRGDKKRTYRVQDGIVIDHETGKKAKFNKVMKGNIDIMW